MLAGLDHVSLHVLYSLRSASLRFSWLVRQIRRRAIIYGWYMFGRYLLWILGKPEEEKWGDWPWNAKKPPPKKQCLSDTISPTLFHISHYEKLFMKYLYLLSPMSCLARQYEKHTTIFLGPTLKGNHIIQNSETSVCATVTSYHMSGNSVLLPNLLRWFMLNMLNSGVL